MLSNHLCLAKNGSLYCKTASWTTLPACRSVGVPCARQLFGRSVVGQNDMRCTMLTMHWDDGDFSPVETMRNNVQLLNGIIQLYNYFNDGNLVVPLVGKMQVERERVFENAKIESVRET